MEQAQPVKDQEPDGEEFKEPRNAVVWVDLLLPDQAVIVFVPVADTR